SVDSIVSMASTTMDCWLGPSALSIFATSWFDRALSGSNADRPRLPSDQAVTCIMLRGFAPNPPPLMKCAQNTAQVSRIQSQFFAQLCGRRLLAIGEFIEHADFGQGQRTVKQPFLQNTDLPRVEAIEAPDGLDA